MLETLYRRSLLAIAGAPPVERLLRERGMQLGVARFVAGSTLDEALPRARELEGEGLRVILDLLGEFVDESESAQAAAHEIVDGLDLLRNQLSKPAMSVKPTQLGLGLGYETALEYTREIASRARDAGVDICLDMENHPYVDGTLRLFRTLFEEGFHNVSTVLQSYLRRSEADLESLLELHPKPALRIVKGAYREPSDVAFQEKAKVDAQYRKLLYRLLEAGGRANIATHDERILREAEAYLKGSGLAADRYEMQLLYGVKPALQRQLCSEGHPVRVYMPFGHDWYGYFSRRLAERPANLAFVLRGLFG